MVTMGSVIRAFRLDRNMTQDDLAEKLHVSKSTVCRYEAGDRDIRAGTLDAIAVALGVSSADMLSMTETGTLSGVGFSTPNAENEARMLARFRTLNLRGQMEALKRIEELTLLDRYTGDL